MSESSGAPKLTIGSGCDATDPQPSRTAGSNFEFAFNSRNFSDRVLRIEVMEEPPDAGSSGRKRRRGDGTKEKDLQSAKELTSTCEPKTHDCEGYENHNEGDESAPHELTPSALQAEETAFEELLSFMYSEKLSITPPNLLLDVLLAADKFEVVSCMQYCSELLRSLPVTTESALLYLDLPCSTSLASAVQPLIDVAKDFLVNSYKDIAKFQDEMMNLPVAGIEVILSSDDLQAASEDAIYDFVLKWARTQYTVLGERRDILSSRLLHHIRFAHLSCSKLRKILICDDLDHDLASKLVAEALFFKSEAPFRQRAYAANQLNHRRFVERAYKFRPLKVVDFDRPHPQCIVYLDLEREECAKLFPSRRLYSRAFYLGGQNFYLLALCNLDQQSSFHCFGLFLGMREKGSISRTVNCVFAARTKQLAGEFATKHGGRYTLTGRAEVGFRNLIDMNWSAFIAEDSPYFIDGTLHLRAEVTIKPPQPPPQQ